MEQLECNIDNFKKDTNGKYKRTMSACLLISPSVGLGCVLGSRMAGVTVYVFGAKHLGNYTGNRRLVTIGSL